MKNPFALIAAALSLGATAPERPIVRTKAPKNIPRSEREERKRKAKFAKQSRRRNRG